MKAINKHGRKIKNLREATRLWNRYAHSIAMYYNPKTGEIKVPDMDANGDFSHDPGDIYMDETRATAGMYEAITGKKHKGATMQDIADKIDESYSLYDEMMRWDVIRNFDECADIDAMRDTYETVFEEICDGSYSESRYPDLESRERSKEELKEVLAGQIVVHSEMISRDAVDIITGGAWRNHESDWRIIRAFFAAIRDTPAKTARDCIDMDQVASDFVKAFTAAISGMTTSVDDFASEYTDVLNTPAEEINDRLKDTAEEADRIMEVIQDVVDNPDKLYEFCKTLAYNGYTADGLREM